jgi:serine/threonine-protein kinase SRPK3
MSPHQSEDDDVESLPEPRFLLPQLSGADTEDVEKYRRGGFHPVYLGDVYNERYKVVHKLGAGGFSTVWLARDEIEHRWFALKIFVADYLRSVSAKSLLSCHAASQCTISVICR